MAVPQGVVSAAERESFRRDGWLIQRGVLSSARLAQLQRWVDVVTDWAELVGGGPGMHHFEQTDAGPRLARSEDLVPNHAGLRAFISEGQLLDTVGGLFGEPAVLFKEKINHKQPGGAGFAPHQDAPAYRFVDHHISCMVPLDPSTRTSGCLWVARGHGAGVLPMDPERHGCIAQDVVDSLEWVPVELLPGDLLWFDSYLPHRSDTNRSDRSRRAMYLTYNALQQGDHRERYYADKRREFAAAGDTFGGERVRISVNDDFLGRPAAQAPAPRRRPVQDLFDRYEGPDALQLYDEAVTELSHGLQCAELAAAEGAPPAWIAAALLHDVGHLLIGDLFPIDEDLPKDFQHEEVGARYLERWFDAEVTEPVRLHVAAKRYLVTRRPGYFDTLSPSSVRSLAVQGGPMSEAEALAFEALPGHEGAVKVRIWDDLAKDAEARCRPFSAWTLLLTALVQG